MSISDRHWLGLSGFALISALSIVTGPMPGSHFTVHAAAPSDDGSSNAPGQDGADAPAQSLRRDGPQSRPSAVIGVETDGLSCFMGGARDGKFQTPEELADAMRNGQSYRLMNLVGERGIAESIGLPVHEGSDGECIDLWRQELSIDRRLVGSEMVAFAGEPASEAAGQDVEILDEPLPAHVDLLKRFLSRRQIADPDPRFEQVIKADLQGDGTPEYILNVVRMGEESARAGDHSLLLVLRGETASARVFIVQDEVTVEDSDFPSTLWRNKVVGVLDVDGDGVSEIVTNGQYIYGGGWEVIRFDGSGFEHVLFCGCDG